MPFGSDRRLLWVSTTLSGSPAAWATLICSKAISGLDLKSNRFRHAGLVRRCPILGPIVREMEPISDRQAGIVIGQRQR
jgi:hypothetical protein